MRLALADSGQIMFSDFASAQPRMGDALNIMSGYSPKILLEGMQCAVDEFVDGAEQFDDLTMLALEYKGTSN